MSLVVRGGEGQGCEDSGRWWWLRTVFRIVGMCGLFVALVVIIIIILLQQHP